MIADNFININFILIASAIYLIISAAIAKAGSEKKCGSKNAFAISLALTPITGMIYVYKSRYKRIKETVHFRCPKCGLAYTDGHEFCPSCDKEGKKTPLKRICMLTY